MPRNQHPSDLPKTIHVARNCKGDKNATLMAGDVVAVVKDVSKPETQVCYETARTLLVARKGERGADGDKVGRGPAHKRPSKVELEAEAAAKEAAAQAKKETK